MGVGQRAARHGGWLVSAFADRCCQIAPARRRQNVDRAARALVVDAADNAGRPTQWRASSSVSLYLSYLIPGLALATGALLADPLQRVSPRGLALALPIAAAVWLLVFASPSGIQLLGGIARFVLAVAIVMLAAIAFRVSSRRSSPFAVGLACVLLLLVVHRGMRVGEPGERELSYRVTVDAFEQLRPIQDGEALLLLVFRRGASCLPERVPVYCLVLFVGISTVQRPLSRRARHRPAPTISLNRGSASS